MVHLPPTPEEKGLCGAGQASGLSGHSAPLRVALPWDLVEGLGRACQKGLVMRWAAPISFSPLRLQMDFIELELTYSETHHFKYFLRVFWQIFDPT